MSINSCFQIFSFSLRRSRTPTGKPNDCTCAWCCSLPVLVPDKSWVVVADEVGAGFLAPVGVMDWPGSSASLAAMEQLAVGCSDPHPHHPYHPHPIRASRNCRWLGAGVSSGLAFGVTRFDWAIGILQMTIVTERILFLCMHLHKYIYIKLHNALQQLYIYIYICT